MEIQMSSRGNLVNLGNVDFNESIGGREIVGMYIYVEDLFEFESLCRVPHFVKEFFSRGKVIE